MGLTIFVQPRVQIQPDSQGRYRITPQILNDLGRPIVTANYQSDFERAYPVFTVGPENAATDTINVAIQYKVAAVNINYKLRARLWITEDPTTCALSTANITSVPSMQSNQMDFVTSDTGYFPLDLTYVGAKTFYICLEHDGRVHVSPAIVFS